MIRKIQLLNYRRFEAFTLDFTEGLNILVGDNDAGKSTILEAVRIALTGRLGDRWFSSALSPHHFNQAVAAAYVAEIRDQKKVPPPDLVIDLFLADSDETATLRGTNNLTQENAAGLRIKASLDPLFHDEYQQFIANPGSTTLVPVEYYKVEWLGFNGNGVTARSVPATVSRIDASSISLQSGADYYMQQIIQEHLAVNERVEVTRAYRTLRETFANTPEITTINEALAQSADELTDKSLSLAVDVSYRTAWESSLVPHLDELPFQYIGEGAKSALKILLALERTADSAHVVVIEEPENHLSPGALNALVRRVADRCEGKQVLVSTHSSYVLNKLGLEHLILLHDGKHMRLTTVPPDTLDYFKRLSGYDTLRVVLASRCIFVEGPSDELIVQRAYRDVHGRLPIEDGVDVINVRGLSFKRFLDIAAPLGKRVHVITDNDGASADEVKARYADYTHGGSVTIHVGPPEKGTTLEPQVVTSAGRPALASLLGTTHSTDDDLVEYMKSDKTAWALRVFESKTAITMPEYIREAVEH